MGIEADNTDTTERVPGAGVGTGVPSVQGQDGDSDALKQSGKGDALVSFVKEWYGLIIPLIMLVIWGASLQYKVDSAKNDIGKNENIISNQDNKIVNLEKFQVGVEKDITFLYKDQNEVKHDISRIKRGLNNLEKNQLKNNIK